MEPKKPRAPRKNPRIYELEAQVKGLTHELESKDAALLQLRAAQAQDQLEKALREPKPLQIVAELVAIATHTARFNPSRVSGIQLSMYPDGKISSLRFDRFIEK
jgi:hypothetical protein